MAAATTLEPAREAQVVEACQRGDREAFRVLFEAYKDRVYSLALHFTGDDTRRHDVTQEVFLKIFSRIDEFRGGAGFSTWLYRIVANTSMDDERRRRRLVPLAVGVTIRHPSQGPVPYGTGQGRPQEDAVLRQQVARAVRAAVARLKPKLRIAILLRHREGLSSNEMALALGCSPGTVAARLSGGHKILARRLAGLRGVVE